MYVLIFFYMYLIPFLCHILANLIIENWTSSLTFSNMLKGYYQVGENCVSINYILVSFLL